MAEAIVLHQFCQVMLYFLLAYDLFELHGEAKISCEELFVINLGCNKNGPNKNGSP